MKTDDFIVTQMGTETHIFPSAVRTRRTIALLLLGGTFVLVGGFLMDAYSMGDEPRFPGAGWIFSIAGGVSAVLMWGVAAWSWWGGSTPLVVESTCGEVRYGKQVLCEPGTVEAVHLRCSALDDHEGTCEIGFVVRGRVKTIPSPLFASMTAAVATELAESVAALLKVNVQPPV